MCFGNFVLFAFKVLESNQEARRERWEQATWERANATCYSLLAALNEVSMHFALVFYLNKVSRLLSQVLQLLSLSC